MGVVMAVGARHDGDGDELRRCDWCDGGAEEDRGEGEECVCGEEVLGEDCEGRHRGYESGTGSIREMRIGIGAGNGFEIAVFPNFVWVYFVEMLRDFL